MRLTQLLSTIASQPWAIDRVTMAGLLRGLMLQARQGVEALADPELEAKLAPRREAEVQRAEGVVALVPVHGVLMQRMSLVEEFFFGGASVERLMATFSALQADDQVKAIVFNFDTPGGHTYGISEFFAQIFAARGGKPVIAQVNSACYSAGLWLASACDEIVVTPGGGVGSVGVFSVHEEMSKLFEQLGVTYTLISSGGLKGANNEFTPLSDELQAELKRLVDYADAMFRKDLAKGRALTPGQVKERYGNGGCYTPAEAVANGLVDRIAPLGETIARFGGQAILPRRAMVSAVRTAALQKNYSEISPSVFEDALREAFGFSKTQATAIAGHGLKILRQGEPDEDRGEPGQVANPSAASLIDAITASAGSYKGTHQ